VVAGTFAGSMTIGTKSIDSAGDFDVWVAQLMPDGTPVWAVPLGGPGRDVYPHLVLDSQENVYVTGNVSGTAQFGPYTVGGAGGLDGFVTKLRGADGTVLWAKSFGSIGDDASPVVARAPAGPIMVGDGVAGPLQPGGPSFGVIDVAIMAFEDDGTRRWTKTIGTSGADYALAATADSSAFYLTVNLGADIGPTVDGVVISGVAHPTGLLLKIAP
jgi:hypothetical protein